MVAKRIQDGALLAALGSVIFMAPHSARADFFLHYWENHHESPQVVNLGVDFGYYDSKQDFDPTGASLLPNGLNDYSRIQGDFAATYGLSDRFDVYGRMSWARVQLDSTKRPGSAFGLTDQTVGINYRLVEGTDGKHHPTGFALDFQLQGDFPTYDNTAAEASLLPYMGDGSVDGTAGAFATLPLSASHEHRLDLVGGAGYTYRTQNFSAAIPWSVEATYAPIEDGFFVSAGVLGEQSLKTDPKGVSAPPAGVDITAGSAGTSGSFITNAVNPSLLVLRGSVGYQFGTDVGIRASYTQSVWGQDAPVGMMLVMGLEARLGNPNRRDSVHLTPKDYGRSNQGFVNYSSLEAHVMRVNDRLNLVKIDKGSQDGVEVGEVFDIFIVKKDGSVGEAVARGKISSVNLTESALTVGEYYKEVWIEEGFIVKHPLSE